VLCLSQNVAVCLNTEGIKGHVEADSLFSLSLWPGPSGTNSEAPPALPLLPDPGRPSPPPSPLLLNTSFSTFLLIRDVDFAVIQHSPGLFSRARFKPQGLPSPGPALLTLAKVILKRGAAYKRRREVPKLVIFISANAAAANDEGRRGGRGLARGVGLGRKNMLRMKEVDPDVWLVKDVAGDVGAIAIRLEKPGTRRGVMLDD
jgi:hypothetical protein